MNFKKFSKSSATKKGRCRQAHVTIKLSSKISHLNFLEQLNQVGLSLDCFLVPVSVAADFVSTDLLFSVFF